MCLLLLALAACGPVPHDDGLPKGALLAGDADALRRIALRLERLAETPLGREARVVRDRLEGCKQFVASTPNGDAVALFASIRCDSVETLPKAARALLGAKSLVIVWPFAGDGRLAGAIDVSASGSVDLDATLRLAAATGLASLVMPAEAPSGAAVLADGDTLLHARFRPEAGIKIASLVPAGSQADAMFRLKSELFAGTVLDGTWEAAIYLPDAGHGMPPIALAVGTRAQAPAVAAMEKFIADLGSTWAVTRHTASIAGHEGACLSDLRILPEFAPCYVATDRALVVGWNAASVAKGFEAGSAPLPESAAALVVRLDRFPEADERLRQVLAPGAPKAALDYAWQRAELRAERVGDATRIRVELRAGGES
jgi:hypothetical protein